MRTPRNMVQFISNGKAVLELRGSEDRVKGKTLSLITVLPDQVPRTPQTKLPGHQAGASGLCPVVALRNN